MIISVFDRAENIVGKGEIARYEQFLLFPQCFQKASFPEASKGVIVWEWLSILYHMILSMQIQASTGTPRWHGG